MAVLRATIKTVLANDSTLTGLLPGGIFDANDLKKGGMSLEDAPKKANGININPFALLRWQTSNKMPGMPDIMPAELRFLNVWIYDEVGQTTIEQAILQIKALLNVKDFTADEYSYTRLVWAGELGEIRDPQMGYAAADRSRYQIILMRK